MSGLVVGKDFFKSGAQLIRAAAEELTCWHAAIDCQSDIVERLMALSFQLDDIGEYTLFEARKHI